MAIRIRRYIPTPGMHVTSPTKIPSRSAAPSLGPNPASSGLPFTAPSNPRGLESSNDAAGKAAGCCWETEGGGAAARFCRPPGGPGGTGPPLAPARGEKSPFNSRAGIQSLSPCLQIRSSGEIWPDCAIRFNCSEEKGPDFWPPLPTNHSITQCLRKWVCETIPGR
jgi:hypothetical protein